MEQIILNGLKLKNELGHGGMAIVYLANLKKFDTQVAVKVLNKEYVHNENIRKRFLAEARNMYRMSHPNIVKVTDLMDEGNTVAFVMEYIEGETLKEYLERKGKLKDDEIKNIFAQMLDALGYVHKQNLVHRDIKPSNFMINREGKIKLMDFGIAKNLNRNSIEYTITEHHQIMGTVMYMSPEHIKSTKEVTYLTDIYSLGVVLWQMVAGEKPYDSIELSAPEIQASILKEPLPNLNSNWDSLIQKATSKDPDSRYLNCNEFLLELNRTSFYVSFEDTKIDVIKVDFKIINPAEKTIIEPAPPRVIIDPLGIEFIWVEGGTFLMGEAELEDTRPHKVTLNGYYLGKYPVTQEQWLKVMGDNPSKFKENGLDCPVENVSWYDCQEFIEKANRNLGTSYRLPTEAEWEFAARGGDLSKGYEYAGSDDPTEVAWGGFHHSKYTSIFNSNLSTFPVGQKKANEIGLHDMSGNINEWCADWYGNYPTSEQSNPQGPSMGTDRVFRGGSWASKWMGCRIKQRKRAAPEYRQRDFGFRLISMV